MDTLEGRRIVYRVSELTHRIKQLLEGEIGDVWLEGEISNFSRPSSGHLYFTLKDDSAQIRAAFFKGRQRGLGFAPADGMNVRVRGQVSVFERSGQYQIIVSEMEEAGRGSLHAAFEALKKKLEAEGLFDPSRKKPLPLLPQRIGMITSPTGAVIRDMCTVLTRRFPNLHLLLVPVKVQGDGAAESIAKALDWFNEQGQMDVLIVARGGGSLEDLWAFNEEVVARAIHRSRIPVISAVGHETDYSISDFVADVRAPTPSVAAEIVIGPKTDWEATLQQHARRLGRALDTKRLTLKNRYAACAQHWVFKEPTNVLRRHRQQLSTWQRDMTHALGAALREQQQRLDEASLQMRHAALHHHQRTRHNVQQVSEQLRLLSPRAVLERGYSITRTHEGSVVRRAQDVSPATELTTWLADGQIESTVTAIHQENQHDDSK